jgi:hypothetical protein
MAIPFLNNINLSDNELQNAKLHITGTAPTAATGQIYYDSSLNVARYYDNDGWVRITDTSLTSGTFVSATLSGTNAEKSYTVELSATGTSDNTTFLRGDNTWATVVQENDFLTGLSFNTSDGILTATVQNQADVTVDLDGRYLTGNETITLTGEVTGSGATSIETTVADGVLDVANFNASAIVIESEGIENNDNDTTLPTSAAVKAYVDASTVGGLVYQGGYNPLTNSPDLTTSPNSIKKGWTYTSIYYGTFFGEQLRVGDVLIAEVDNPSSLADWTTVQNNIDLASATQIGIGNVAAGTGISVSYSSGTAIVSSTDTNASNTATGTITAGNTSGTVTHNFGTLNTIVQTIDSNGDTVFCDISRTTNTAVATIASAQAGDITILVQKIG